MNVQRRTFLRTALGATAATVLSACSSSSRSFVGANPAAAVLPSPEHSGIDHVVVVMMENRSFDHFLGWLPNADGKQAGLSYADQTGAIQNTYHLAGDFSGCGHVDPDHSYQGARIEYNAGKMDGFLRSGNDTFVDPFFSTAAGSVDDHPFADIRNGDAFLSQTYHALVNGPCWPTSVLIITFDEWGGFFDHVPPPRVVEHRQTIAAADEEPLII